MTSIVSAQDVLSGIFGVKPKDSIYNPRQPYSVRFNCQVGQLAIGDDDFVGKDAEISIIKAQRHFGSLGKTQAVEWLQIFYIPAPECSILPANTVCVSYLKTRSLAGFEQLITRLIGDGINPAEGIFKVSFLGHTNDLGKYYSVRFDWRKRKATKGNDEIKQLEMIKQFMMGGEPIMDLQGSRDMYCIEGLSAEQVETVRRDCIRKLDSEQRKLDS